MTLGNDGALKGRLIAIVILTAVSGGSFTLGYYVGRTNVPSESQEVVAQILEENVAIVQEPPPAEPQEELMEEPIVLKEAIEIAPMEPTERKKVEDDNTKKRAVKKKQPQGTYSVQAGVFKEKNYAELFALKLQKRGYNAFLQSSGDVYVVKVGKFENKADAEALSLKLKEAEGIDGFVTLGPG
jgi:cell division protein FtsN